MAESEIGHDSGIPSGEDKTPSYSRRIRHWVARRYVLLLVVTLIGISCFVGYEVYQLRVRGSNETSAIAALRTFLKAQDRFQQGGHYTRGRHVYANTKDGLGFPDLYRVGGPDSDGELLELIPIEMARATSPEQPYNGYYFVDFTGDDEDGKYDFTNACGMCAVPADYPRSGRNTFIVDLTGTVYPRDNGGKALTSYPPFMEWYSIEHFREPSLLTELFRWLF